MLKQQIKIVRPARNVMTVFFCVDGDVLFGQCSDWPGLSRFSASSRICTALAPLMSFQSSSTQTTFLAGVTSMICALWPLPREQKMVLPFASRVQLCGALANRSEERRGGEESRS